MDGKNETVWSIKQKRPTKSTLILEREGPLYTMSKAGSSQGPPDFRGPHCVSVEAVCLSFPNLFPNTSRI
jgi:hypothetical protein